MNAYIKIQVLATERKKGLSKGKDQESHITVQKLIYFNSSLEEKYFHSFNIPKDEKKLQCAYRKNHKLKIGCKKLSFVPFMSKGSES